MEACVEGAGADLVKPQPRAIGSGRQDICDQIFRWRITDLGPEIGEAGRTVKCNCHGVAVLAVRYAKLMGQVAVLRSLLLYLSDAVREMLILTKYPHDSFNILLQTTYTHSAQMMCVYIEFLSVQGK